MRSSRPSRRSSRSITRKRLPLIALENLEGRSLFSASLNPAGELAAPAPYEDQSFGTSVATQGSLALIGASDGTVSLYDTSTQTLLNTYTSPTGSADPNFGHSLTFLSSPGSFAIGSPEDGGGGMVFVYLTPFSSPVSLSAQTYIGYDPNTTAIDPSFGSAVAGYGDNLLVSTQIDVNSGNVGTVQEIDPLTGSVVQTFHDPEASVADDNFGQKLAVSGNQVLFWSFSGGTPSVYLFDGSDFRNDQGQLRKFSDPTGDANNFFGYTLAFDGDNAVMAAPQPDPSSSNFSGGSVYQFSASTGQLIHTFAQPASLPTLPNFTYTAWGFGLAISNNHLLISAPDAATPAQDNVDGQIFAYDLTTGDELANAVSPEEGSNFGSVLAPLPNDTFIVTDFESNDDAGAAHLYQFVDTGNGGQTAPPTADAGPDQTVIINQTVNFSSDNSSAAPGATITGYAWDFNYDGTTFAADSTDADPSHVFTATGVYHVALQVTDDHGHTGLDVTDITVNPAAPTASAGPDQSAQTNQTVSLHGTAAAGAGANIANVAWDFNYDGSNFDTDATTADSSTIYTAAGTYTVAFRVTDDDGQSALSTAVITVTNPPPPPVVISPTGDVQVTGSAANDTVAFSTNSAGQLIVTMNGTAYGPFANAGSIIANLGDGNDVLTGNKNILVNMEVYGGAGNDSITGGGGSDILVGGDGNDTIIAGKDRDIIIGSAGADNLSGKQGQDIVIAASTSYDSNPTALEAILAEWDSSHSFDNRVSNLLNGTGTKTRANGNYFLTPDVTVIDDSSVDTLTGDAGKDWLIFNVTGPGIHDICTDAQGNNLFTDL